MVQCLVLASELARQIIQSQITISTEASLVQRKKRKRKKYKQKHTQWKLAKHLKTRTVAVKLCPIKKQNKTKNKGKPK